MSVYVCVYCMYSECSLFHIGDNDLRLPCMFFHSENKILCLLIQRVVEKTQLRLNYQCLFMKIWDLHSWFVPQKWHLKYLISFLQIKTYYLNKPLISFLSRRKLRGVARFISILNYNQFRTKSSWNF